MILFRFVGLNGGNVLCAATFPETRKLYVWAGDTYLDRRLIGRAWRSLVAGVSQFMAVPEGAKVQW